MRFKIHLRGKEWTAFKVGDDLEQCNNPAAEKLKYKSLTQEEWLAVVNAEDRAMSAVLKRIESDKKKEQELIEQGAVRIRNFVWEIEDSGIYRYTSEGKKELKFSELTNEELACVMEAKAREGQNRGIGGFFRRLNRKINEF